MTTHRRLCNKDEGAAPKRVVPSEHGPRHSIAKIEVFTCLAELAVGHHRYFQNYNGSARTQSGHLDAISPAANLVDVCQAPREFASQGHSE